MRFGSLRPLKGTFKARTSKASSLLNFLSSALARPKKPGEAGDHTVARGFERLAGAKEQVPHRLKPVRNDKSFFVLTESCAPRPRFPIVENQWKFCERAD